MSTRAVEMQETRKTNAAAKDAAAAAINGKAAAASASASPAAATASYEHCPTALTMALSRVASYGLLSDAYRRYLTTHLESGQVWYLLSLSLLSAGAYDECFLAVRECLKRHPTDIPALLLASQLCVNRLKRWKESVEYSSRALRGIKSQISHRAAHAQQGAIAAALAAAAAAKPQESATPQQQPPPASSIAALAAAVPAASSSSSSPTVLPSSSSVAPSPASSFTSLTHNTQIESSLLLTAQMLFGLSCSKYAYHVSTFSNRKSLQKRALHALEAAYNSSSPAVHGTLAPSSSPASSPSLGTGNKKLSFYLACLYSDIREIPRALATLKKCLLLDRSFGPGWNLLALLLSAQKKYASAVRATENGLSQLTGGTSVSALLAPQGPQMDRGVIGEEVRQAIPLLLTKARLLSHVGNFEESVATFNDLIRLTFDPVLVHFKPLGGPSKSFSSAVSALSQSSASSSRLRPVLSPSRNRDESTEKTENCRMDARPPTEVEWASTKVEVLLALAGSYAAQAAAQASGATAVGSMMGVATASGSSRDDSLLADAFDAAFLARELAPTSLLPDVHAALAALHVQSGRPSQAVRHYESALVLESNHTASLIGLARIENQRVAGNLVLAYGYLMSALQVDATSHHAWYEMGLILQSQNKASAAAEHFLTALELEKTAPIASFATIRREFV